MTRKSARDIGDQAETTALGFLEREGLKLITRNYRCRSGELDLVMRDRECLVFIEVRYRRDDRFGSAAETVTPVKRERIISAAAWYLQRETEAVDLPCRFDVVALSAGDGGKIEWVKDAFRVGT